MKLVLTDDEICQALLNCIVDGGVKHLLYADVTMDFDPKDYKAAKKKLKKPCAEDVYLQILKDGKALTFTDEAGKDPPVELTLKKAKKNFKNPKAILDLVRLLDPNVGYDSLDCYNVLQYAVFGELKYS